MPELKNLNPAIFDYNVGIDTDTPTSKLSVMDSATQSAADAGAIIDVKRGALNGNDELSKAGIRIGNNSNFFGIYYGGSTGRFRFINGSNVEVLTLRDDGNVGIGKTDPSKKLEVNGEISAGNVMNVTSNLQNEGGKIFLSKGLGGTFSCHIKNDFDTFKIVSDNGASTSTQLCIDHANGFMGIGTSTPKAKCVISESGLVGLEFNPSESLADGTKCNKIESRDDSLNVSTPLVLNSSKTIFEGGFVGVGTQFPSGKLHVHGGELFVHDAGGAYNNTSVLKYNSSQGALSLSSYSTTKDSSIQFETSSGKVSSEKVRIKHNGNVGIGITDPSTNLQVDGEIKCKKLNVIEELKFLGSLGCPVGSIFVFAGPVAPNGWLLCDGSLVSQATYSSLFNVIKHTFSGGNIYPSDFKLPDLRGEFVRGLDSGRGLDVYSGTRLIGSNQSWMNLYHTHPILFEYVNLNLTLLYVNSSSSWGYSRSYYAESGSDYIRVMYAGTENRPRNIAMNYIIKY